MKSFFDIEKLESLLKDYYTVTQIRITVFDANFNELIAYPKARAKLCGFLRKNPEIDLKCRRCDKDACKFAAKSKTPYVYRCHVGLTEIISPLIIGDELVGYLFFAHIFSFDSLSEGVKEIVANVSAYGESEEKIKKICAAMPLKSTEYIDASANLLSAVASYLCLQSIALTAKNELAAEVERYVLQHLDKDLSAEALCERFCIGRTKLYAIAKQRFGEGLAEHVKTLRLEKARSLLEKNTDIKVSEVAERCGFSDYNYFIANFRTKYGVSPRKYSKGKR